ncbi:hypothetical protein HP550_20220 [Cellulomonas humilata]|uniref:DUF4307 domain-containing protein n=1 Tax=Cellulomonas humilata TaxID=144055 RepID=A0A7Y6A4N8_9CELL|nr:hypothetical protein [Cellulomonas humilata]NUU19580.1 hypothetical protein [Cellulomonas humilata]
MRATEAEDIVRRHELIGAASILIAAAVIVVYGGVPNPDGVCPAIAYSTAVEVTLDPAWTDHDDLLLDVRCQVADDGWCDLVGTSDGSRWAGRATSPPETVHVTVRRGAEILAQEDVSLSFRTIDYPHGRACPGIQAAEATVPPPR